MSAKQPDWDHVHLSNFESKAFWHIHWMYKAKDLVESAHLLEPKIDELWENYHDHHIDSKIPLKPDHYISTYFMLMAFAAENIFKAGIVLAKSRELKNNFRQSRKFPKMLQSHDLVKLAKIADMKLGEGEEELLRRLSRSAIWHGRYPIPLEYKKMSSGEIFSDGYEYLVSWHSSADVKRICNYLDTLPQRLGIHETEN